MSITKNDKNTRTTGRPTLNEVARRAGVSPITASRALRGVASVAEELAQKVRDAARELGYVANPAARALASAQSHSVAVLVPSLANLLFIETLEAIHAVLRPQGLEVLIGNFHYSRNEEEDLIRNYLAYQPRGLLLTGFERTESARRMIEASGIPCVYMMDLEILTPRPSSVALGGELFVQLLASQPQVDGVFFCNDDLAQGALLEALRRGVKVPEQIAVLGFNDLPGSDCTVPRLSSIRTPREAIGRRAAEQLLALIAGKEVRDSALDMGFELMAREST